MAPRRNFSRVLSNCKLQAIARNSDRFLAMFAPFVIVGRITLLLVFRQASKNRSVQRLHLRLA
mgnify:FL=1